MPSDAACRILDVPDKGKIMKHTKHNFSKTGFSLIVLSIGSDKGGLYEWLKTNTPTGNVGGIGAGREWMESNLAFGQKGYIMNNDNRIVVRAYIFDEDGFERVS